MVIHDDDSSRSSSDSVSDSSLVSIDSSLSSVVSVDTDSSIHLDSSPLYSGYSDDSLDEFDDFLWVGLFSVLMFPWIVPGQNAKFGLVTSPVTRFIGGLCFPFLIVFLSLFSTKGIKFLPMHFHSHMLTLSKHWFVVFMLLRNTIRSLIYKKNLLCFDDPWLHKFWRLKVWPFIRQTEEGRANSQPIEESCPNNAPIYGGNAFIYVKENTKSKTYSSSTCSAIYQCRLFWWF